MNYFLHTIATGQSFSLSEAKQILVFLSQISFKICPSTPLISVSFAQITDTHMSIAVRHGKINYRETPSANYCLDNKTTLSTCRVPGNISTAQARTVL